jgi:hypothetical protein
VIVLPRCADFVAEVVEERGARPAAVAFEGNREPDLAGFARASKAVLIAETWERN